MKVIDKILDNYYSDKLEKIIVERIRFKSFIDVRTEKSKLGVYIKVKEPKFKESEYEIIYAFKKEKALEILFDIEKVKEEVSKGLEDYFKEVYR